MMWFKKKRRNKRFGRDHVLDVKLCSSQRRENRLRRLALALGISCAVFFGLFVAWRGGEWLLRRFVYENPSFAIHAVDVETDGDLSREQIRRWAGVKLDDNLFATDLARIQRDLELVPMIQSADVERVLQHTLKIRVSEREPMAQFIFPKVAANGSVERGVYTLDRAGFVMLPLEAHQRATPLLLTNDSLPVLIGISAQQFRPSRQVEARIVHAALQLIQAFDRSSMASFVELRQLDLSAPNVLQVTTAQNSEVLFGLNDLEGQLRRWRAVYAHGEKVGKHLASLDLSVSNNIPARWLEANLVPPSPVPKPNKPSRNRKKHV